MELQDLFSPEEFLAGLYKTKDAAGTESILGAYGRALAPYMGKDDFVMTMGILWTVSEALKKKAISSGK
jgi:hypothetical protein